MTDWLNPEHFDVPVRGGNLRVARWGTDGPVVLGIHGITASHMEWPFVGRDLRDDVQFVAPDLRGRGGSRDLPGPYGMKVHAEDCVAVLDHLGVDRAVVAGHSMGAFVAAIMAMHYPERVSSLILIDGGVPLAEIPPDADIEQILNVMLGPSIQRCSMTFESVDQCFEFWQQHPAIKDDGAWNDAFAAYVSYDLMGEPPELRTKVVLDAVLGDGRDTLTDQDLPIALEKVASPVLLMRASRGILNEPTGLYSDDMVAQWQQRVPGLRDDLLEDINHFTLVTSERGGRHVAIRIREALNEATA
jgi:lipase